MTLAPPDYKSCKSRLGGHIREFAQPFHRWFPHGNEKRKVIAKIGSFIGISPGARHFYVSLKEEHNQIWDGEKEEWVQAWDDVEGKGKEFSTKKFSEEEARKWVLKTFREKFSTKTHKLQHEYYKHKPKWMYVREGD